MVELLDRRLLALARSSAPIPVPASVEAVLLIEFEADSPAEARNRAQSLVAQVQRQQRRAVHSRTATEPEDMERLSRLRELALPGLYALRGSAQAVPCIETYFWMS